MNHGHERALRNPQSFSPPQSRSKYCEESKEEIRGGIKEEVEEEMKEGIVEEMKEGAVEEIKEGNEEEFEAIVHQ